MKTGILAAALLCALAPLAQAQSQAQRQPQDPATPRPLVGGHGNNVQAFIAEHDLDNDGRVTWAEFERFRRQRFDATDANHDGVVDETEYVQEFADRVQRQVEQERAGQLAQTRTRFAAIDTDKDGRISRAEFDATGEKTWQSGQRALAQAAGEARPGKAGGTGKGNGKGSAAGFDDRRGLLAMPTSHSAEGFLALYDSNGDGKVDRTEYERARDAQFARSDRDHDGKIDQDEYLAEYEDRLDRRIALLEDGEDKQAHVRFGVLDTDKDGKMTFAEYQASGKRLFDTADRNHDGTVDAADAQLPPPKRDRT